MKVLTLRDYAKQNKISYEAVRKQVVRYKKYLGSHVIQDGRQQFLDEEAVAFLDSKRQKNPVAIIQIDKDTRIEELENRIKQMLVESKEQADRIAELSNWKAENALAIAEAKQNKLLLEEGNKKIAALEAQNGDLSAELQKKDEILEDERKMAQKAVQEAQKALDKLSEAERTIQEMKGASLMKRLFGWKKENEL